MSQTVPVSNKKISFNEDVKVIEEVDITSGKILQLKHFYINLVLDPDEVVPDSLEELEKAG